MTLQDAETHRFWKSGAARAAMPGLHIESAEQENSYDRLEVGRRQGRDTVAAMYYNM